MIFPALMIFMDRKDKILKHVSKAGFGLEIGPSHSPIAPKKEGYQVHTIDHLNREGLIEKYQELGVQLENIEDVDFVWRGETYAELTGKTRFYDWVIASHVIEHTPDLVGFLNHCAEIMKDDAVLSLAVPDKRYCFDRFRPLTGLSGIIDAHYRKGRAHTPGTVAEYYLNIVARDGQLAWDASGNSRDGENYSFIYSLRNTLEGMAQAVNGEFIDVHAWCFTPHSFRLIVQDLFDLGLIPFREVGFHSTEGSEFFVTLGRTGKGIAESRFEMVKIIEAEVAEPAIPIHTDPPVRTGVVSNLVNRLTKRAT